MTRLSAHIDMSNPESDDPDTCFCGWKGDRLREHLVDLGYSRYVGLPKCERFDATGGIGE